MKREFGNAGTGTPNQASFLPTGPLRVVAKLVPTITSPLTW